MMNIIAGVVNSDHILKSIVPVDDNKHIDDFNKVYQRALDTVQSITPASEIKKDINRKEVIQYYEEMQMLTGKQNYKQLDLQDEMQEEMLIINPVKVRMAYCMDDV